MGFSSLHEVTTVYWVKPKLPPSTPVRVYECLYCRRDSIVPRVENPSRDAAKVNAAADLQQTFRSISRKHSGTCFHLACRLVVLGACIEGLGEGGRETFCETVRKKRGKCLEYRKKEACGRRDRVGEHTRMGVTLVTM